MLNNLLRVFLGLLLVLFIFAAIQWGKIWSLTHKGDYALRPPWQHINPKANFKVLFAGDSTAVGTGASDNSKSTSGWFSRDYPEAHVENYSQNGLRLEGLLEILTSLKGKKFDIAVLQIGANDIMYFTSLKDIQAQERQVLDLTKQIAQRIVILHSGNIGEASMFIWPFTWVYKWRSLKVREIYKASQDARVTYIDIYNLNKGRDLRQCYAVDQLHLNDQGYYLWYSYIISELKRLRWIE